MSLRLGQLNVLNGGHQSAERWASYSGIGSLAGVTEESATITRSITTQFFVGSSQQLRLILSSNSAAHARGEPGRFPIADGSLGFALTFGITVSTPGAYVEWNGAPWSGSCDDSAPLVPENPVPAPSAGALFGLAMLGAARRRRG